MPGNTNFETVTIRYDVTTPPKFNFDSEGLTLLDAKEEQEFLAQINEKNEMAMESIKKATDHLLLADKLSPWSLGQTSNNVLILLVIQYIMAVVLALTIFVLCKRSKMLLPTK